MKILMVNKFLHPVGGAETYMLELGTYLEKQGHRVEYFGMEHPENTVGNTWGLYTTSMDFHRDSLLAQAAYPLKIIYSFEAKKRILTLLEQFRPDVMHINNFHFHLTPSILLAADAYRRKNSRDLRIIYTAHDSQLVCPNHLMFRRKQQQICSRCLSGSPVHCIWGRCIHNSFLRSCLGALESIYWKRRNAYDIFDAIVCPSFFMKKQLDTNPVLASKTTVLHNFVREKSTQNAQKQPYILYFGRLSEEKGIHTLLNVCCSLPHIPFVFAGQGPLETAVNQVPNVRYVGFLHGEELDTLIRNARFSVCPSECNENCPFSVIESMMLGTPVLGSNRGGIPELIEDGRTGWHFPSGDAQALRTQIERIWACSEPEAFSAVCRTVKFDTLPYYVKKLWKLYLPPEKELLK